MVAQYGPTRLEDAPRFVTVLGRGKWPRKVKVPFPRELLRQRAQINELARLSQSLGARHVE